MAASLIKDKTHQIKDICKRLGISTATLYRYVSPAGELRPRSTPSEQA
jgi:predicted site-specific integrase-resolvase